MKYLYGLAPVLIIFMLALSCTGTLPERAAESSGQIPIKAALVVDEASLHGSTTAALFKNVQRVMNMNKVAFETLDVSAGDAYSFVDVSGNPKYSVVLILAAGNRISQVNSEAILAAANIGSGIVALWPDAVNPYLSAAFGISSIGTVVGFDTSFFVTQDKFTFSYGGQTVSQSAQYRNHSPTLDSEVVATFSPSGQPALWVGTYGAGKTVFHNTTASQALSYQGILMQSVLYAMPMGVASPTNVAAFEVDDCPMPYYSDANLQSYYYEFMTNLFSFQEAYNLVSSHFVVFSYSGDTSDFWSIHSESEHGAAAIIANGDELGLHAGSFHNGLTIENWGSQEAINAEVETTNAAIIMLKDRLAQNYGITLDTIVSYVAPGHAIDSHGYSALDQLTDIKYVGTGFDSAVAGTPVSLTDTAITDTARLYLQSAGEKTNELSIASLSDQASILSVQISPEALRDFGWEPGTNIYNLPRIQGNLSVFINPDDPNSPIAWDLLRSMLESGQPYLVFTHANEVDEVPYPGWTWADVFEAYTTFADFATNNYPFYRWQTSSQIGDMLSSRSGTLDGLWQPETNTLVITVPQPNDAIRIKSDLYLAGISQSGNTYTLTFSATDTGFTSASYDVVFTGHDYFIYPIESRDYRLTVPATPFTYQEVGLNRHPELSPP